MWQGGPLGPLIFGLILQPVLEHAEAVAAAAPLEVYRNDVSICIAVRSRGSHHPRLAISRHVPLGTHAPGPGGFGPVHTGGGHCALVVVTVAVLPDREFNLAGRPDATRPFQGAGRQPLVEPWGRSSMSFQNGPPLRRSRRQYASAVMCI